MSRPTKVFCDKCGCDAGEFRIGRDYRNYSTAALVFDDDLCEACASEYQRWKSGALRLEIAAEAQAPIRESLLETVELASAARAQHDVQSAELRARISELESELSAKAAECEKLRKAKGALQSENEELKLRSLPFNP